MDSWVMWLILAGLVLGLELVTGTFYLIMISIGLAAAGIAALMGANSSLQTIVAAVVWITSTLILRKTRFGKPHNVSSEKDPNVNIDIGQTVKVDTWIDGKTARANYRGAMWDIELIHGEAVSGTYIIRAIRGSRLYVEKLN
ncbi:NfeD family protein [Bdellovibrio sp. ZAP7]|uniref:NfeD family protein n=1 Tax=Bdellovibrio sp. ZAP7 TaxID=2231053 RepID=UPI0011579590|nr:NfeD family protein [Bdellovibrio sp. ZAP7]QDK44854.1 NfeD family protein [Bdellovibrio sp. ZAP7]